MREKKSLSKDSEDIALNFENCYNVALGEDNEWRETGKSIFMRWILPQAVIDLEEEKHEDCSHYVLTVEFSDRHFDWSAQKLRFGSEKDNAISQAKKIVEKISKWPLFNRSNEK